MNKTLVLVSLLFGLALGPAPSFALSLGDQYGLSPYLNWKSIETEHFRITFAEDISEIAMRSANYLEEAHKILSPKLQWEASYKTSILIVENTDLFNGATTPVYRFGIILQVAPPDNWSSVTFYDDWLRLLIIHEYTHFLNMDVTESFWKPLRYIFGDTLLPNIFWPTWMLEGLAVYMETRYTQGGRGRSSYYEMILRAAVQEGVLNDSRFITLDEVNGSNPYYPGGETPYIFGYTLMNQAASQSKSEVLGEMSYRSGGRIPFFINGNLENITGKTWYDLWDDWVSETKKRAEAELTQIKAQSVTAFKKITQEGFMSVGPAVSPDGKWLAYTQDTSDNRSGLIVKNLETGKEKRILDKKGGIAMRFLPDSKILLFSAAFRNAKYNLWSDLGAYHLDEDRWYLFTDALRAKDPDVSPDGKWITFTLTKRSTSGIALAPLLLENGKIRLGEIQKAFMPPPYHVAATPKFSQDGSKIYFSMHKNEENGEGLYVFNRETKVTTALIRDGHYNQFPAIHPDGTLYYVSDKTGAFNLYRWSDKDSPEMVSNMTTGISFPTFDSSGKLYASVFSSHGWDVAQVDFLPSSVSAESVTLEPAPAPIADEISKNHAEKKRYSIDNYSIFPSILPRQWAPLAIYESNGNEWFLGGQISGFDTLDLHRYFINFGYDTLIQKPEYQFLYANRMFGPVWSFLADVSTDNIRTPGGVLTTYSRKTRFRSDINYPFQWTYSTLTPGIALNFERQSNHRVGTNSSNGDMTSTSSYVPSADLFLAYSNSVFSRLSIEAEGGRSFLLGTRLYRDDGRALWKGLAKYEEFVQLFSHSVLIPSVKASMVSRPSFSYSPANVVLEGRRQNLSGGLLSDDFDQLSVRGYPAISFFSRGALVPSLDLKIPLAQIFRGWGTNPLFLQSLQAVGFLEMAYLPFKEFSFSTLPSAGGGLRSVVEVAKAPITFSLEYHQGFQAAAGGTGELFFAFGLGALDF